MRERSIGSKLFSFVSSALPCPPGTGLSASTAALIGAGDRYYKEKKRRGDGSSQRRARFIAVLRIENLTHFSESFGAAPPRRIHGT
ncbi:hypothetical protein HMPREF1986_00815 [Oribacterium sp. oral taxon 078 str. F0263]|nr:hypothetical protein HMPREF1986_00815 [Oribacterium sp. oral taxon 078 str. F0263]